MARSLFVVGFFVDFLGRIFSPAQATFLCPAHDFFKRNLWKKYLF